MRNKTVWIDLVLSVAMKSVTESRTDTVQLSLVDRHMNIHVNIGYLRGFSDSRANFTGVGAIDRFIPFRPGHAPLHLLFVPIFEMPILRETLFKPPQDFRQALLETAYDVVQELWQTKYKNQVQRLKEMVEAYDAMDMPVK